MRIILAILMVTFCIGHGGAYATESRFRVVQLNPNESWAQLNELPGEFSDAIKRECQPKTDRRERIAPIWGAFLGIAINWMFDRALSRLSDRLVKKLVKYSETYSNNPAYYNIHDERYWTSEAPGGMSCVVFQRIECETEACGSPAVGLSVGFKVKRELSHIRVLPVALQLSRAAAEHSGGNYAIATQLKLHAPVIDEQVGGTMWESPATDLLALGCKVNRDKSPVDPKSCVKEYRIEKSSWSSAKVIPLPPPTVQAFVVSVAEAGEPPRGLKGLSAFLDTSQGELSDVLSAALIEKLKLEEE